jgi:hypothetical protein
MEPRADDSNTAAITGALREMNSLRSLQNKVMTMTRMSRNDVTV